MASAIAKVNRL